MKRLFIIFFLLFLGCSFVPAQESRTFEYEGNKYSLLYSEKSAEHNGYFNQYFKDGEESSSWTEVMSVQHFPNIYSPIDLAYTFREFLGEHNCPSSMFIDEEKNIAMLDFILIDTVGENKLPVVIEFNVFKYEKYSGCGTVALQYAKKYMVYDAKQVDKVKKKFEKFRPKAIKKILEFDIPEVVQEDIGEIKLNDLP